MGDPQFLNAHDETRLRSQRNKERVSVHGYPKLGKICPRAPKNAGDMQ